MEAVAMAAARCEVGRTICRDGIIVCAAATGRGITPVSGQHVMLQHQYGSISCQLVAEASLALAILWGR